MWEVSTQVQQDAEGSRRIADAQTVHGSDTKAARSERSRGSLRLAQLEDAMHLLCMTSAKRIRGRKPIGYTPFGPLMTCAGFWWTWINTWLGVQSKAADLMCVKPIDRAWSCLVS